MELAHGEKLGPYEIQRKLGAGGMGVVYRALDGRLGRAVAIKVLPIALKGDPERLKRFEREARTIGGLNHGNLVTLFDVGTHDGVPFLVTELLEGKSLRQALAAAPNRRFSTREAVRVAGEIARGLAAAHGAGVTHRDIKPENIFVLADDRVKILDFGIAKLADADAGVAEAAADGNAATLAGIAPVGAQAATAGTAHTGTGMVIGTPGYMAPEQLAGGAVGPRTDIFALGVVFYEMLAGRRPFAGDDDGAANAIEESYAILKQVTPELPTSVPPAIVRVVRRCLEKRPEARFQSASDLAFALGDIESAGSQAYSKAHETAIAQTQAVPAIAGLGTESSGVPALATGTTGHVKTLPGAAPAPVLGPDGLPTPPEAQPAIARAPMPLPVSTTGGQPTVTAQSSGPQVAPALDGGRAMGPWIFASVVVVAAAAIAGLKFGAGAGARGGGAGGAAATAGGAWPTLVEGGVEYHRVTFLPQSATFAKFMAGDRSVAWSARKGDAWRVMQSDVAAPSLTDLELTGRLLDVSAAGEFALRVKGTGEGGALERARPGGGPPVFVADHVEEAQFTPDGQTFAILRALPDRSVALEDPVGKPIANPRGDGGGSLAMLAMSRTGDLGVVFADGPVAAGRVAGKVTILKPTGELVAQSAAYGRLDGLAWHDDELWFSEGTNLRALRRDGSTRLLVRSVLPLGLEDVAADGTILVAPREQRTRSLLGPIGGKGADLKNVSWFDGTQVTGLSADGETLVFLETSARDASGFPAYRRRGTQPPVRIGSAFGLAILPDASAALAITGPQSLQLVPSDGKPATELPRGGIARFDLTDQPAVAWSGKYAVVRAAAAGKRMRLWRYDLTAPGAPPIAIGPEIAPDGPHPISSDGAWIAVADRGSGIQLLSTAQPPEPAKQLVFDDAAASRGEDEHVPLAWADDDASLVIAPLHGYPRPLERYTLATQARAVLGSIAPEEKPDAIAIVVDGRAATLAYSLVIESSVLDVIRAPVEPAPPRQ